MKTIKQVAQYFSVSEMTVRRWIDAGRLPITKIGKSVRIDEEDIQKLKRGER